ncbi:MAG TPA: EF-P lysine aminoacylase EpmA [Candidatus Methanoperedens sp.]|nr:EF-P lysine aminoacylase EpmA [Candidatus Methanoperedens sp.]
MEYGQRPLAERLRLRDLVVRRLRDWFHERGYLEVDTPQRVACPGIDVHVDAIPAGPGRHLATSPELEMKKLLASGCERIVQVTRAFRAGERGERHAPEFTLVEWYAAGADYRDLMAATEELVAAAADAFEREGIATRLRAWPRPFPRLAVDEAFARWAGWRPSRAFDEERFFADFVTLVEPRLAKLGAVFLADWPAPAGALARRRPDDPAVCERVELFLDGVEICNGFSELTDAREQEERFARDNAERKRRGREAYPVDRAFLDALASGIPPCAGNALGLDRLLMALTGSRRLAEVTLLVDP